MAGTEHHGRRWPRFFYVRPLHRWRFRDPHPKRAGREHFLVRKELEFERGMREARRRLFDEIFDELAEWAEGRATMWTPGLECPQARGPQP